jgi:hypothetical protein
MYHALKYITEAVPIHLGVKVRHYDARIRIVNCQGTVAIAIRTLAYHEGSKAGIKGYRGRAWVFDTSSNAYK